jgi:hypothetical protein
MAHEGYITSIGSDPLPKTDEFSWFNLWSTRLAPYRELKGGDLLFWYDPASEAIVLKTEVISVEGFEYHSTDEARNKLIASYGSDPQGDPYFDDNVGERRYGFVFRVKVLGDTHLPKPEGEKSFPRSGWLRCDDEIAQHWLKQEPPSISADDLNSEFRLWLFRFALDWSVPKEKVPPYLGRAEIDNRQTTYPLLAAALAERPITQERLAATIRACWAVGDRYDLIKLNEFLKHAESPPAIEFLLDGFPVESRRAAGRIDEFIAKLGTLGYSDPKSGRLNMSSAGLLASVLLSAAQPSRFVDFRQQRWSGLAVELRYPLLLAGRSTYGEMLVRAGQFAKAISETATFQKWWPAGEPLWSIAGIAWAANSGQGLDKPKELADDEETYEEEFEEGQRRLRQHFIRERSTSVVKLAKELWRKSDPLLRCDACGFSFAEQYGDLGQKYIEAHHTTPVSKLRAGDRTKVQDLAKVCANCHRMLHVGDECMTIEELRAKLVR